VDSVRRVCSGERAPLSCAARLVAPVDLRKGDKTCMTRCHIGGCHFHSTTQQAKRVYAPGAMPESPPLVPPTTHWSSINSPPPPPSHPITAPLSPLQVHKLDVCHLGPGVHVLRRLRPLIENGERRVAYKACAQAEAAEAPHQDDVMA
jgi:hypothetical protein